LTELQTVGTVLQEPMPANPYNNSIVISAATYVAASPPVAGTNGWNYDADQRQVLVQQRDRQRQHLVTASIFSAPPA
jgi:hypothetical protein